MRKKYIMGSERLIGLSMKLQKQVIMLLVVFFGSLNAQAQVTVSGAVTGNNSYTTLGAAFAAIGTSQAGANIVISITGNTTETSIASLGAGNWASVRITPAGGSWTVSGFLDSELIKLDGADNVTIDGLNSGGNGLTIRNTSASWMDGTSTIKFINDATNNTITNCTVQGSGSMSVTADGGVIFFSTGINGNDMNTISNCNIGPAGTNLPTKLIYSKGTLSSAAAANSGITITNCKLYDFFYNYGSTAAIYALPGSTDWAISNNKIYQTANRIFSNGSVLYGIYFSNPTYGDNVRITGNTIGYANDAGTGTLEVAGPGTASFTGIFMSTAQNAVNACIVNNNTISNVKCISTTGTVFGINNGNTLNTPYMINFNGNTIRNLEVQDTTGDVYAINGGTATTLTCNDNIIENISRSNVGYLYGIRYGEVTTATLNANTITALQCLATNGNTAFYGIGSINQARTETITNNVLTGCSSLCNGSQTNYGIYVASGTLGNKTIRNNTVSNFTLPALGSGTIYGIQMFRGGALNEISSNKISSFSGGANICGINVESGTTNNIFKNKIHGLSTSAVATSVYGINFLGGTTHNVYNNIVGDLNASAADISSPTLDQVVGVNATGGVTLDFYNNTVVLNAENSGAHFGSSAVDVADTSNLKMRNNILVNISMANGAGLSVALRMENLQNYNAASNNNLFYGTAIYTDGTNTDLDLNSFRTRAVGRDVFSKSENPSFASITGSAVNYLHINPTVPTRIEGGGMVIATLTDDFDGDVRNTSTPDIGADEFAGIPYTAGVNDFALANLKVYPNPVNDVLKIENSQSITNVEVFNVTGQKVISKSVNAMTVVVPMSGLTSGTYFVKVFTNDAIKTVKLIKK